MKGDTGLQAVHVSAAVKHGLELYSYSQAIICEGFKPQFGQQVVTCAMEFAIHARRISEMNGILRQSTPLVSLGQFRGGDIGEIKIETDYNHSLNRLVHAKTLAVNYVDFGKQLIFPNENNFVLSYLQIETDQRETAFVSFFGISAHFLTIIAPGVLEAIREPIGIRPNKEDQ